MPLTINFDRPLGAERRRLAVEQIDCAIAELSDNERSLESRVHELRRHCKKLRALARLFRSVNNQEYSAFNNALRDVARKVSDLRDADASLATLEKLLEQHEASPNAEYLRSLRHKLQVHREQQADRVAAEAQLTVMRAELETVREGVLCWSILKPSRKTIHRGLGATYKKAYEALHEAKENGEPATWHEWRKQVKYLRYQLQLVRQLWPTPMDCWQRELHRLSNFIGFDHDLAELLQLVSRQSMDTTAPDDRKCLEKLCQECSQALRRKARALGEKLFEDDPAVTRRAFKVLSRPNS